MVLLARRFMVLLLVLSCAEQVGQELLPIVQQEPTLRQGSYASAMEEVRSTQSLHTVTG